MLLSRKALADYADREFNSYLWMKELSRATLIEELKSFKVPPKFKTEPWLHQLVCTYIGLCEPRFLFMLDMGLGKSKILLDLITQTQREKTLRRALVTVPRLINIDSWTEDMDRHSDLEPWAISMSDIEAKREALLSPRGDVSLIDYQGLHWALCDKKKGKKGVSMVRNDKLVKMAQKLYNFVAIDESHKLKNHQNLWFGIVHQLTKSADRVYAATGTLFGRDVEDIWAQFYLVDQGETFGENLGLFRRTFFTAKMSPWKGQVYSYNVRMTRLLNKMLQNRSLRYDESEVNDLPARVYRRINLDMGAEQKEHYLRAVEGVINSGGDSRALEAPWLRMRQITSGYLKWKDDYGDHSLMFKQNPKLDALERLIDEMGDSKIVVCYDYTDTGRLICDRLTHLKIDHEWFYGGTKDKPASRLRFMSDPGCRVFVMNSEAGGTGNDGLQKVARYMVFYESPTPVITRKQTEKRIHRPGQTNRVFIYDLALKRSVDGGILTLLAEGKDLYSSVVGASSKDRKNWFLGS
jgi:SNF2 family DNA or RNA helicase